MSSDSRHSEKITLKDFLKNQKYYWVAKRKEVDEHFLEVDKGGQDPIQMTPKSKKRKTATKEVQPRKGDPMPDMQQSFKLFFSQSKLLTLFKVCIQSNEILLV